MLALSFIDGSHFCYEATAFLWTWFFKDGTVEIYDAKAHLWKHSFEVGAVFQYDAAGKAYSAALPGGATYSITLNGATIFIDASGNIVINGTTITLARGWPTDRPDR